MQLISQGVIMAELGPDSTETGRLLEQARAGQPGAVDRLLSRHRGYLRQLVALRLDPQLRARVDPSDVVQEAQLEAVRRLEQYLSRPPLPFRLWLRQLAYDRLLMLRRKHVTAAGRAVEREVALPDRSSLALAAQLLSGGPTPSEQMTRAELGRRVRHRRALLRHAVHRRPDARERHRRIAPAPSASEGGTATP
jgi:RNA polymerase sigma-70 factor (ECF subfamily)